MTKRRGYEPKDEQQFTGPQLLLLQQAAEEVQYLLDRKYSIKQITTFVGNHYMFSERQRLALARSLCPGTELEHRKHTLRKEKTLTGENVHIDGFNTIITLEVALSGSMVLECRDGCFRDLAGLRGTYRIIEVTTMAINMILEQLKALRIGTAIWYLDAPVSNSGRLKTLILELAQKQDIPVQVEVLYEVDQTLETKPNVITSDAIILDRCQSWIALNSTILSQETQAIWSVRI